MPRCSSRYQGVGRALCALAAVVALVWLAACAATGGQPAAAPASAPVAGAAAPAARGALRFAVAGLDSNFYSPIFIAEREGYYRELGLELDTKEVNPPTAHAGAAGQPVRRGARRQPGHRRRPQGRAAEADLPGRGAVAVLDHRQEGPAGLVGSEGQDDRGLVHHGHAGAGREPRAGPARGQRAGRRDQLRRPRRAGRRVQGVRTCGRGRSTPACSPRAGAVVALADGQSLLGDMHGIKTYDYTLWASNQALENKRDLIAAFVLGTLKGRAGVPPQPDARCRARHPAARRQSAVGRAASPAQRVLVRRRRPADRRRREAIGYKQEASGEPSAVTPEQMLALDLVRQANAQLAAGGWKP